MEPTQVDAVLASEARRRAYDIVCSSPGISVSELARRMGAYWTSAALHVAQLVRGGLVSTVVVGRRRVLFATSAVDAQAGVAIGILGEAACARVAVAIAEHPGLRVWELCELLDMSDRAVYHHVKRLVAADLVQRNENVGYRGLRASARLLVWIAARPRRG